MGDVAPILNPDMSSLMVLFTAALLSYIILSALWSQARPGPATEKDDDSTPPASYHNYQLPRPTAPSHSPSTDDVSPTKESSKDSERTEHSLTGEGGSASTQKEESVSNS
nr:uncharacterized protein LOC129385507 [Dermacentor andersoni]